MNPVPKHSLQAAVAAALLVSAFSGCSSAASVIAPAAVSEQQLAVLAPGMMTEMFEIGSDGVAPDAGPDTRSGGGEPIPSGGEAELTNWGDVTQMPGWKEYPADPVLPDGMAESIASIVASMQPGEWRKIMDAPYLGEAAWADKASYDPVRHRVSYVGAHGVPDRPTKWVMWDIANGQWHRQVGDQLHPYAGIHSEWGFRTYGHYTQLTDGSNIYARFSRLWKQNPQTLEWEPLAMHPCFDDIGNIDYFPEMNAVISLNYSKKFCAYIVNENRWVSLPTPRVDGRHSLMRYNPVRGEMLLLGGDASYRAVEILRADGSLTSMAPAPRDIRITHDILTVDPISGHYLVMTKGPWSLEEPAIFYGYDSADDHWYVIDRWEHWPSDPRFPLGDSMPVSTPLTGYGVSIWLHSDRPGVHLYKHNAFNGKQP